MLLVLLVYGLYGFSFTLSKITLSYGSPLFIIGIRMIIGGILIGSFFYIIAKNKHRPKKEDWFLFLQAIVFGIVLPYSLREWGLNYLTSTKAAFTYTLMPFMTALFAYLFNRTTLSWRKVSGLIIGFVGTLPIFLIGDAKEQLWGSFGFFTLPELAMLGAVASFSYYLLILKKLVVDRGYPTSTITSLTMLSGGLICLLFSQVVEPVWIIKSPGIFLLLIAAQILIANIICINLEASLLRKHSSTLLAFANLLEPLFVAFFGWSLLSEQLHLAHLLSFVMVCIGLGIFYFDEIPQPEILTKSIAPTKT